MKKKGIFKRCLGWREWVSLPDLKISKVKAKIDSGARTSALHAYQIEYFHSHHRKMVRFEVHPKQKDNKHRIIAKAEVIDERDIMSSSGHITKRPVILTTLDIAGTKRTIELTLVNRDIMGFRMLIGRQAIRRRFLIDPGRSFLTEKI